MLRRSAAHLIAGVVFVAGCVEALPVTARDFEAVIDLVAEFPESLRRGERLVVDLDALKETSRVAVVGRTRGGGIHVEEAGRGARR